MTLELKIPSVKAFSKLLNKHFLVGQDITTMDVMTSPSIPTESSRNDAAVGSRQLPPFLFQKIHQNSMGLHEKIKSQRMERSSRNDVKTTFVSLAFCLRFQPYSGRVPSLEPSFNLLCDLCSTSFVKRFFLEKKH